MQKPARGIRKHPASTSGAGKAGPQNQRGPGNAFGKRTTSPAVAYAAAGDGRPPPSKLAPSRPSPSSPLPPDNSSLLRMAGPLVASRAGLAMMAIVDAIMVARYDGGQLAVTILAEGTFGRWVDISLSFLLSGLVLVAAAQGPMSKARRIALWHRSLAVAVGLGLTGFAISLFATPILGLMGQDPALALAAGPVITMLGLGLPAGLIAVASAVMLEGSGKAGFVALWIVIANILNLVLNWLLIGGHFGLPELGALGAASSTSLVRIGLAVVLVSGVVALEGRDVFRKVPMGGRDAPEQWKLGASAAGTSAGMHAIGIWLTLFAGWIGPRQLAAYASGWILNLPGLLLAMGIGDGISMRVAQAREGGASTGAVGRLVRADMATLALVLSPFTLILCLFPTLVATLYTTDPALQLLMAALLPISGIVLILDGMSYGAVASLRGCRDVTVPMIIQIACMLATVLIAAGLGFGLGWGVQGLVIAILLTSTARLALLTLRLFYQFPIRTKPSEDKAEHDVAWG